MKKNGLISKCLFAILVALLSSFVGSAQVASSIELTGTSSSLSALYNVETVVDPNLVITANGTINGFRVQISESYSPGDVLSYTGTLPSGITKSWSSTTGVLSFSGSGTTQQWQDILRAVKFQSTSSVCYPTARAITFTAGTVYYNPLTGHFYEYVANSPSKNWANSKTLAEGRSYFGRLGYLATFNSAAENSFTWKIMATTGWFGASDDFNYINNAVGNNYYVSQNGTLPKSEGQWHWVTGPEAGIKFSAGNGSPVTETGQFASWSGGEPNNSGGSEHYGQFYAGGSVGRWNDLPNSSVLAGFLCEYGGMPNDNTDYTPFVTRSVTVSGSSTGTITGGGINVCTGSNSTTLSLTDFIGTVVRWESSPDNFLSTINNISSTSPNYTVTNITQTTYYRAVVNSTSPNVCNGQVTSSTPIYVTPTLAGNITAVNNTICAGGDVELTLTGNQGNINKWQWSSDNGTTWNDVANTTTFLSQTLSTAGTYLFRAEVQTPGCGAAVNTSNKTISVISGTPPDGGIVSTSSFCGGTNSGTLNLTGHSGTISTWQLSNDNGIVWSDVASSAGLTSLSFSSLSVSRLYRVKVTNGSCGNAYSQAGGVLIYSASVAGTVSGAQNICGGFPISSISLSGNTGTVQWQSSTDNVTFSNISGATSTPLMQSSFSPLTTNTYIRAAVTNGACATANSNAVLVSVETPDTLYQDTDGDGFGNPAVDTASCVAVSGYVGNDLDCNDGVLYYVDADGDGFGSSTLSGCSGILTNNDCDDSDATINVSGVEVCNGEDDDCDGSIDEGVLITFYQDADNDGFGATSPTTQACTVPTGYSAVNTDCNDALASTNPGATEVCNGVDDDCDGNQDNGLTFVDYYTDSDVDGFGTGSPTSLCANPGSGFSTNNTDCDDLDNNVNPSAIEICNYIDDNCTAGIDENVTTTYYQDLDGDNYGNESNSIQECGLMAGYAEVALDCDDGNANVNPSEIEICNSIDDDCDEEIDEFVTSTFYADADNDGFGNPGISTQACSAPVGYVSNNDDCDDAVVTYLDNDGDGFGSTTVVACGETNNTDCNDNNATLNSITTEVCNNFDDDCDGSVDDGLTFINYYVDNDGDGYGAGAASNLCANPGAGYVTNNTDCNDNNATLNSITTEVCNNFDDDCDGSVDDGLTFINYYVDNDGDGYGTGAASNLCANPGAGYVTNNTDCNDNNATLNSITTEVCNNFDDDCDGSVDDGLTFINYYADNDGDGYGAGAASNLCANPGAGYVTNNTDCNDNNATLNSISAEVCNNFDDDCDGSVDDGLTFINYYVDNDGDGYGAGAASNLCANPGSGYVTNNTDCNDNNATLNSISAEVCNNFDDDCDGTVDDGLTFINYYVDNDGDGYGAGAASNLCANPGAGYVTNNTDCNDNNATLNSISAEVCNNFDDDCDGSVDDGLTFINYYVDNDGDGYGTGAASNLCANPGAGYVTNNTDCNDNNATLNSISAEVCNNFDDDCDGSVDDGLTFINYYVDNDGDGYGTGAASNLCANPGAGYVTNNTDCNDNNATLNSITTEVCNNLDDDCDGSVDDGLTFINYYADNDGDGYGAGAASNLCANPGAGYSTNNTDCDDTVSSSNPGSAETCNDVDDDCNGVIDNNIVFINYYADNDGDGYGAGAASNLCANPGAGYVTNNTDCNDNNATLNSITTEVCNNFDDDCDGSVDDGLTFINYYVDNDGDGYGAGAASNLCANPGAGYVTNNTDCNDNNATLNSITTEVCNNFDDDCDGSVDDGLTFINYYVDNDGDGYGAGAASNLCANPGAGYVTNNTDCNDNNATLNSITTEVCNNFDDDCDGSVDNGLIFIDYYVDNDGDGYGAGAASNLCANPGAGYVTNNTDCNDNNATLNSITTEVCNNFDDDCDGSVDNGLTFIDYYVDNDGDGYGVGAASNLCANPGAGYVTNNTDCNDNNATLNSITTEVCNNFDDDCDGSVDNGLTFIDYYVDNDGDGYGIGTASNLCNNPGEGYTTDNTDCDDAVATTYPGATEACNDVDDDCNGVVDNDIVFTDYYQDNDGDGFGAGDATSSCSDLGAGYTTDNTDCNDADGNIFPTATELCNYIDDNCDNNTDEGVTTTYYADADADGYGEPSITIQECGLLEGYSENGLDCDDTNADVSPAATEICNTIDDNCDGEVDEFVTTTYYADNDGDGFGSSENTTEACELPIGYVTNSDDCDDNALSYLDSDGDGYGTDVLVSCGVATADDCDDAVATTYPGATEACNDVDDDCNGVVDNDIVFTDYYQDNDGDGFGAGDATSSCSDLGAGYTTDNTDCNDADGNIFPTATELCNYIDDNCDNNTDEGVTTTYYADADADGYGEASNTIQECGLLEGYSENGLDCDDTNADVSPAATEICNTIDDNCDGEVDEFVTTTYYADNDGDGFGSSENTTEACELPIGYVTNSDDCDDNALSYLDSDGDGYGTDVLVSCGVATADDCDDAVATTYPGATEACNEVDDDCNGVVDNDIVFTDYYLDNDGDGFGAGDATSSCSDLGTGYTTDNTDCNDSDAMSNPNGVEVCGNGIDENCDTVDPSCVLPGCTDVNACNYNDAANEEDGSCVYPAESYLTCDGSCINDSDLDGVCDEVEVLGCTDPIACNYEIAATEEDGSCIMPVEEICNQLDDDCDGETDEFVQFTYYNDLDGDGFGNIEDVTYACNTPVGYVNNSEDCDDTQIMYLDVDGDGYGVAEWVACGALVNNDCDDNNAEVYPTNIEVCNLIDDNCNAIVDEGVQNVYYLDNDGDGFGWVSDVVLACTAPVGYVSNGEDCDDNLITYQDLDGDGFGSVLIVACGVTNNSDCNDSQWLYADNDGDGFGAGALVPCGLADNTDCDDNNASVNTAMTEVCNELDDNCNTTVDEGVQSTYYADQDGDGFGDIGNAIQACSQPIGYVVNADDCDDNALTYFDGDGDGFGVGSPISCGAMNNSDCDDVNPAVFPSAIELCNGLDDNCSGTTDEGLLITFFEDADTDGFGNPEVMIDACTQPSGFVQNDADCNDALATANPSGVEVCNGIDEDCDGQVDEGVLIVYFADLDGDGYGNPLDTTLACQNVDGYVMDNTDCNDTFSTAFPDAQEINDDIDNDCDGLIDEGFEFIPDAFSPNGDGDYDLFELQDLLPNEVVTIQVFNRWGGLVYESENYQNDWDGRGNVGASAGEHLAVGTFFYIIHFNVAQMERNGYITLWR